jgi:mannose-6-phosphate isomerase-like protein (cupin superfamily)
VADDRHIGACDPLPKTWGWSTRLFCNEQLQLERIYVRPGGYSSIHLHKFKHNQFVVSYGEMSVQTFDQGLKLLRTFDLRGGDNVVIPIDNRHQFVAKTEVEGYEMYWPENGKTLEPNDIVRFSENGLDHSWTQRHQDVDFACCCVCNKTHRIVDMFVVCLENALRNMCRDCVNETSTQPLRQEAANGH